MKYLLFLSILAIFYTIDIEGGNNNLIVLRNPFFDTITYQVVTTTTTTSTTTTTVNRGIAVEYYKRGHDIIIANKTLEYENTTCDYILCDFFKFFNDLT